MKVVATAYERWSHMEVGLYSTIIQNGRRLNTKDTNKV